MSPASHWTLSSKTWPIFEFPREPLLIYNADVFMQHWHGSEKAVSGASQKGKKLPSSFFLHYEVMHLCVHVSTRTTRTSAQKWLNSYSFVSDLGHIQSGWDFLHLRLDCAVAEGSLQHRLFDPQELTHLLQICSAERKILNLHHSFCS